MEIQNLKIACIGIGNMGSAIMKSVCQKFGGKNVFVSNRTLEKAQKFAQENECNFSSTNTECVQNADIIFLAVKPDMVKSVLLEIKDSVKTNAVYVSMVAGTSIEKLSEIAPKNQFIRIMPNLPAKVGESMTALCCNADVPQEKIAQVKEILESCGKVEIVSESLMDAVTAVSGSGPAYAFIFIEALADAAVSFGMPRNQAYIYAAQTLKGSAEMVLQTGTHPAVLKDGVCSPKGTTIEAVKTLEECGFRNAVIQAAKSAWEKSCSMKN